jgi:hypothetical protein
VLACDGLIIRLSACSHYARTHPPTHRPLRHLATLLSPTHTHFRSSILFCLIAHKLNFLTCPLQVLADYHKVSEDAKHVNNWSLEGVEGLPEDGKLDLAKLGLPPLSMRVRVGRNLKEFPLPGAMTKDDRVNLETKMCAAFDKLKAMPEYGGRYNSLTPGHKDFVDDAGYKQLVDDHFMFKDMAADSCEQHTHTYILFCFALVASLKYHLCRHKDRCLCKLSRSCCALMSCCEAVVR